ncbi:anticodon-binding domain-containing protein [Limtongia smithiae]|uniref:anticodon-binding domain-containing protein n=1 Tax=Limtongia smithiae TaxID=1125753 RepID=UPI0034CF6112
MATDRRNQSPHASAPGGAGGSGVDTRPQGPHHPPPTQQQQQQLPGGGSSEWVIGLKVRVTTTLDNVIVGRVFAYCGITNSLAVIEEGEDTTAAAVNASGRKGSVNASVRSFRIIKTSFIKDIAVLERPVASDDAEPGPASGNAFAKAQPAIGPVNLGGVAHKLEVASRAAGQVAASKGVGVSKEAQELFDAVSKTLPSRWAGKAIVVLDEVTIEPPYTPESCRARPDSQALAHVRKVVDRERKRLDSVRRERKGG